MEVIKWKEHRCTNIDNMHKSLQLRVEKKRHSGRVESHRND